MCVCVTEVVFVIQDSTPLISVGIFSCKKLKTLLYSERALELLVWTKLFWFQTTNSCKDK